MVKTKKKKSKVIEHTKNVVGLGVGLGIATNIVTINGKSLVPSSAGQLLGVYSTLGYGKIVMDKVTNFSSKVKARKSKSKAFYKSTKR